MKPVDAFCGLYGFRAPYQFGRATAFLLAACGFILVSAVGLFNIWHNDFIWDNHARFYVYLSGLFLGAALLAFRPRLAFALLVFAIIETSLSLGLSAYGQITGNRQIIDLRPRLERQHKFVYHPLLLGIPKPGYQEGPPLLKHDDEGRREVLGAETFSSQDIPAVNVYGGSTAYDVHIANGYTWVDNLQRLFGSRLRFYNYGVQGYSTVENIIQTAFYAPHGDRYPVCSVYYLGWNDIRNLHIPNLDPGYANFHLLGQFDNLMLRNLRPTLSPLMNMVISYILSTYETMVIPPVYEPDTEDTSGPDQDLERYFTRNLETLITLNKARKTTTFFVGQILNRERLKSRGVYGWMPKIRDKDAWTVQAHYNNLMKAVAEKNGATYIDVPVDSFTNNDFGDQGHFSPAGALKFSALIAPYLEGCAPR